MIKLGPERSQLGRQYKNQVKWSWKESVGYIMIKLGQMVLKRVNWVHKDKIRSNGLERSQLGTQYQENHGLGSRNEVLKNQFSFKLKSHRICKKSMVLGRKPWFLMKTMLFKVKSTVFGWKLNWKPVFGSFRPWLLPQLKTTLKTMVFSQKLWFLAVLDLGSSHNWKPHWKPQFSVKNCSFQLKTAVFD